jgi:hypothetical protein
MYSYFEEIFKKPNVKNWLNWSEESGKFIDESNINEFYSWMIPSTEDSSPARLPEARSVRELAGLIADESALNVLRAQDGTLSRALARFEVDHPEDWFPKIMAATAAVKSLTPDMLRTMDDHTLTALNTLQKQLEQAQKDRLSLIADD